MVLWQCGCIVSNLIKTTITLPEDLLQRAKFTAIHEKTTVSQIMRDALDTRTRKPKLPVKKVNPMRYLGVFKLGIKEPYKKREDLYEDHIKRKMDL